MLRRNDTITGDRLLVHPVMHPGVSDVSIYFPGTQDIWYDIDTYRKIQGGGTVKIAVTISKVP
jgi:alpha 1,3-glucosidase